MQPHVSQFSWFHQLSDCRFLPPLSCEVRSCCGLSDECTGLRRWSVEWMIRSQHCALHFVNILHMTSGPCI